MSDKMHVETRQVRGFDRVVLRIDNCMNDLELIQGERESLTIEASPDLLPKIETRVRGGELGIRLSVGWWERLGHALATSLTRPRIRYRLEVIDLTSLQVFGFARVSGARLESHSLALRFVGAGRVELAGQVEDQKISIVGAGHYEATNLQSQRATVHLRGAGQASVWALDELAIDVRGLGNVAYRGKPKVRRNVLAPWPVPPSP